MVCRLAYIPELQSGACGRTRTYEVTYGRLIYSQVLLLLSHTCAHGIQISNLTEDFKSEIHLC